MYACIHCLLLASAPFPLFLSPPPPPTIYPHGSCDHQHSVHRTAPCIRNTGVNFRPTVCELPSHSSDSALTQPRAMEINVDNNDDDEAGWRKTTALTRQIRRMINCGRKLPSPPQTVHIVLSIVLCGADNEYEILLLVISLFQC